MAKAGLLSRRPNRLPLSERKRRRRSLTEDAFNVPNLLTMARVAVIPGTRRKGVWSGRRAAMIRPPAAYETPPCPVFGLCGGCSLQELSLDAQRDAKHRYGLVAVRADDVVGWIGRLLGHPLDLESAPLKAPGFVAFSGSGSVLVDLG